MVLIPAGYAQVNLRFGGVAAPEGAEVTFGVVVPGTIDTPANVAGETALNLASANVMTNFSSLLSLNSIAVKFGPNSTGPSAEIGTTLAGNKPEATPPNTALLVRKHTSFGGRAGRGRMYWPGLPEGQVTSAGLIDETTRLQAESTFQDWFDLMAGSGIGLVLLHDSGSPLTGGTPITSLTVDSKVATQRRRLRG